MNHILERRFFVKDKELERDISREQLYQIHHILTRKDFVEDSDVMKQYMRSERPIILHERRAEMNQSSDEEKVLTFQDYVEAREKSK